MLLVDTSWSYLPLVNVPSLGVLTLAGITRKLREAEKEVDKMRKKLDRLRSCELFQVVFCVLIGTNHENPD